MRLALQGDIAGHESKKASLEKEAAYQMEEVEKHTIKRGEVLVEKNDVEQRLAVIAKLETIVKRDFRGYLLQDIIVYINQQAKKYSKTVFGTELVDFSLDGNNIAISYNGKSYESLSGGERQKVDIIIQFSIRDVLCAYTGFHTNIIVLDEIFDNLDEVGSHQVIDLISNMFSLKKIIA